MSGSRKRNPVVWWGGSAILTSMASGNATNGFAELCTKGYTQIIICLLM